VRNFYPGTHVYDIAERIYLLVGNNPFTYREIVDAGANITPGNLARLRAWGIATNLRDDERSAELGVTVYQRVGNTPGVKYWVLTPLAIQLIQQRLRESLEEVLTR